MDPFEFLEPVDISSKLEINFDSTKWQERKEALDGLQQLLNQSPRLADSPKYRQVIERLTKFIGSDSNIVVVTCATKCLTGFAKGLRGKFSPHVSLVVPTIFDKFKEKKQQLKDALIECIDAVSSCTTLDHLTDAIQEAISSKQNPSQKSQLDLFIYRTFRPLSPKDVPKGFLKDLVAALCKHGTDADSEVRDSSYAALGAIMKCIGEKALSIFMAPALAKDANKMAKIVEYRDKAQSEAETLLPSPLKGNVQSNNFTTSTPADHHNISDLDPKNNVVVDPWDLLEPVDISSKLEINFDSTKWQERKEALDGLQQLLNQSPRLADSPKYRQVIERLTKFIGSDSNIVVVTCATKCLTGFAKGLRGKFSPHVSLVVPTIFDKFKEKKQQLKDALVECIDAVSACTTLDHLTDAIQEAISSKQNPSQKSQLDLFIYRTFRLLSPKDVPKGFLKDLVAALCKHGSDADSEVRDSSYAALGAIMKCIGEKALSIFMTPALAKDANKMAKIVEYRDKAQSEAEALRPSSFKGNVQANNFDNQSNVQANISTTSTPANHPNIASQGNVQANNFTTSSPADHHNISDLDQKNNDGVDPWNLLEPVDISSKLDINFESTKWQERKETLDGLQQLLNQSPRLADSPKYRQVIERLTTFIGSDSNIVVVTCATKCLTGFAKGLRGKFAPHVSLVVPTIFDKFKEKKQQLKDALVECIDAVSACTTLDHLTNILLEILATKQTPSQKSQVDLFIYRMFRSLPPKNVPKGFKDLVSILCKHVTDADLEVRDSSYAALGSIMKCIGEKALSIFMPPALAKDANKMAKIVEYRDKVLAEAPPPPKMSDSTYMKRARSSSAVRPGRRSCVTLSSAVSYSSNLNRTLPLMPQNDGGGAGGGCGKFQLDPKFFQNDFDNDVNLMPATAGGSNNRERAAPNSSQAVLDKTFRVDTSARAAVDQNNVKPTDQSSVDLQPIKPVVRPTSTFSRRSESVSSISSLESAEHIDRTVHNISCLQLNIAEEALAQLLHLLSDPITRQYISDKTDLILKTMVTQIFHIRSQHLEQLDGVKEGDPKEVELSDFMRSICNFLISLVNDVQILQRISTDTLRSFIDALLSLVNDQRLKILNKQIFRSLNIVVIRLCEFTNPNVCFVALMKLVMKYQASDPASQMSLLIHKCLTKYIDTLVDPAKIDKVDILTVLNPIHEYYSRFYVVDEQTNKLRESARDTSKFLCIYMQRLVVKRKYVMLNYMYPFPENSHVVNYVRRCIRSVGRRPLDDKQPQQPQAAEGSSEGAAAQALIQQKILSDELMSIFNRISEDPFNGSIEDLYNFMDIHNDQHANFEQQMARCEYASIVRRAFAEIRQTRLKREPLKSGVCVRRVLPDETRQFLDQQNALSNRLDEAIRQFSSATSSTANTPSATAGGGITGGNLRPSPTSN